MKRFNYLIVFLLSTATYISAQDFDRARMDSLFSVLENNQAAMGSISIFKDGEEVYQKSIGYASIEDNLRANQYSIYRIGSITKTFTAAIIMDMIEDGMLSLETTLDNYFPQIEHADKITVEHLLRHRSGIYNFTNSDDYPSWMTEPKTRDDLVNIIANHGSVFKPGEKGEYSNSNYVLLSLIAEKITGQNFEEILFERITNVCNLPATYYGRKTDVAAGEVYSYEKHSEWVKAPETDMSVPVGAGAIVSTPTELNRFLHCLFTGKIISEASLNKMKTLEDNFGIGLFTFPFHEMRGYGHNGGIDGFQSNAAYIPEKKVGIAYVSNGVSYPMNDILVGALSIYFGKEYAIPVFGKSVTLTSEELDQYLGVYGAHDFPLKIAITKDGETLIGQATGQSSFPLDAYENHVFRFDPANLELQFLPGEDAMMLRQGGAEFKLSKE